MTGETTSANTSGFLDCEFAGESAFLTLSQGQTGIFTVFFANTGTITWIRSTPTQVDLAVCLPGNGCDVGSPQQAWNPGSWITAKRYATHTQQEVAPGQIATYTFTVLVPPGTAAGTYRFHGELVESRSGKVIHPLGYYQDVTVPTAAAAATLIALEPREGRDFAGTEIRISGSGFVCMPSPIVLFGDDVAEVLTCSPREIIAAAPMHSLPTEHSQEMVNVVVGNAGGAASNALDFTYVRSPAASDINPSLPLDRPGSPGTSSARDAIKRRIGGIRSLWGTER